VKTYTKQSQSIMKEQTKQNLRLCEILATVNNGCQTHNMLEFNTWYDGLRGLFLSKSRFFTTTNKIIWPAGSGVYVIWNGPIDCKELLYIGMTGTYRRPKDVGAPVINREPRGFAARVNRWTPYCFFDDNFSYGPVFSGNKKPIGNNQTNYRETIPISEITIDFFVCGTDSVAPAFLESLLLQVYMNHRKDIPPANNAF